MADPFRIEGPALVSFSGGRTSAYMLRRILDAGPQPDVHVVFADTGKERAETYEFVRACAERWGVEVHWVHRPGYFTQLITDRRTLPNPAIRFCTQELKIRPMRDFMKGRGYDHWTMVVGIRADEPRRVARMRQPNRERWDHALPLADAGVILADVMAYWDGSDFDLGLQQHEGNCDLCFLKSHGKRRQIAMDRPDLVAWWAEQERRTGQFFRLDGPSYAGILDQRHFDFSGGFDNDLIECACTD